MDARKLETRPSGDIVLLIAREWEKKEPVPVSKFRDVADSLGITGVRYILQETYEKEVNLDPGQWYFTYLTESSPK